MFTKRLQSIIATAVTSADFGTDGAASDGLTTVLSPTSTSTAKSDDGKSKLTGEDPALISLRRRTFDHHTIIKRSLRHDDHAVAIVPGAAHDFFSETPTNESRDVGKQVINLTLAFLEKYIERPDMSEYAQY